MLSAADILLTSPPWRALAPGVAPKNPLLVDVAYAHQPWLLYAARELGDGRFPLWNPYAFTGVPFFANPQTALLFPLNLLAWVLPPPVAVTLIPILRLSVAGLAMYWFLRVLAVRPAAAFAGAVVYMFNGGLAVWLQWPLANAMSVLPLLLGTTERLRTRGDAGAVAALAVVVALAIVAGYPQTALHGLLAAAVWALCRLRGARGGAWLLGRFAAAVSLGAGLAAVQVLPFMEYLRESSALFYRSQWMPVQSLPWRSAIALLMPYYYGSPTGGDFWGDWNFNEMTASVGLVPWVVLPAALLAAWSRVETRFFLGLALVSVLTLYEVPGVMLALGSLPVLSLVTTTRVVPFLALSLSALCAIGLDAMATAPRERLVAARAGVKVAFVALAVLAFLSIVDDYGMLAVAPTKVSVVVQYALFLVLLTIATLVVLRWLRGGEPAPRLVLGLVLVQLASALPLVVSANPVIETRLFYPAPPPAVVHLQRQAAADPGRVILGDARNIGMLYGLREVAGYDGLTPRRVEQVASPFADLGLSGSGALTVTTGFWSPVFDLLGIRRVVLAPGAGPPGPHFALEYDGPDARVYRNDHALPRVFLAAHARQCVDDRAALRLMHEGTVNFREEVFIAACGHAPAAGPRGTVSSAEIRSDGPARVVIRAATDAPAYLVLTDSWFPGWQARVNGLEQPVWRANHAFRAVWLPPGRHEVEFSYRPASFRYGLGLTAAAACVSAGLWFPWGRRRRA